MNRIRIINGCHKTLSKWLTNSGQSMETIYPLSSSTNFCLTWTRSGKTGRKSKLKGWPLSIKKRLQNWRGNLFQDSHMMLSSPKRLSLDFRKTSPLLSQKFRNWTFWRRRTKKLLRVLSSLITLCRSWPKCSNRRKYWWLRTRSFNRGSKLSSLSLPKGSTKRKSTWKEPFGWAKSFLTR